MTAQFWLWVVLSGLGGGIVGWWARGRKILGRELKVEREWTDRLATVEEHSKRCLARAREEAAETWQGLTAERDELRSRLAELEGAVRTGDLSAPGSDRLPSTNGKDGAPYANGKDGSPSANGGGRAFRERLARSADSNASRPRATHAGRRGSANRDQRTGDDLRKIRGIGPAYERALREMGYRTYLDIASWGPEDRKAVTERLGGKARPEAWAVEAAELRRRVYRAGT